MQNTHFPPDVVSPYAAAHRLAAMQATIAARDIASLGTPRQGSAALRWDRNPPAPLGKAEQAFCQLSMLSPAGNYIEFIMLSET